jgi:ubiquinone/menaquinone biosynthesis C-methylase UbiE
MTQKIFFSERLINEAIIVAKNIQESIGLEDYNTSLNSYLNIDSRLHCLKQIQSLVKKDLQTLKILEIGSGLGLFVVVSNKLGIDCIGIEPAANSYSQLKSGIENLLQINSLSSDKILFSEGEKLPFNDETFDVVVSFSVLEHVNNPELVLQESKRVLKKGGQIIMDVPNHFSFLEGHYGLVWFPLLCLSKKVSKAFVLINKRNSRFLNELNLITKFKIIKWTKKLNISTNLLTYNQIETSTATLPNIDLVPQFPSNFHFKYTNRYSKLGQLINKIYNNKSFEKILNWLGLNHHYILLLKKANEISNIECKEFS